jgi:hypothetical protein
MCRQLTALASHDQRHSIARCEHGAIHLFWQRMTLQLPQQDFVRLAQFLAAWHSECCPAAASDQAITLFRDSAGRIQLWIAGVGLYLAPAELTVLNQLAQAAAGQLGVQKYSAGPSTCRQLGELLLNPEQYYCAN